MEKKQRSPEVPPEAAAKELFGDTAEVKVNLTGPTEAWFPMLNDCGSQMTCNYWVKGTWKQLQFEYLFDVKLYHTEKDLRYAHYGFTGTSLSLTHEKLAQLHVLAVHGKRFSSMVPRTWEAIAKHKGAVVWTPEQTQPEKELAVAANFLDWMDHDVQIMTAAQYAVWIRNGTAQILLLEPEVYDFQTQLHFLKDGLTALSL